MEARAAAGRRGAGGCRRGQSAVEFLVVTGVLLATVAVFAVFLYTYRGYSNRVLNLVAAENP